MNVTTRKILIISLGAFMVCLIASTATPVVLTEESNVEEPYVEEEPYWGNLKAGDEMHWYWHGGSPHTYYPESFYELEILAIYEKSLKVYHHLYDVFDRGREYEREVTRECGRTTWTPDELWPWIYPAASIQENEDVKKTIYEYNGSTYTAAYLEWFPSEYHYEYWWDYSTGILFAYQFTDLEWEGYGPWTQTLVYTNANLTIPEPEPAPYQFNPGGFASLDPIVIALVVVVFVAVVPVVLISLARYQKKKKKNT